MEFRKMVTITLYTRQQKRHWCIEQSFGLCGRWRGWDNLREWHWNMYNIIYETSHQSRFNAGYRMLRSGALGWPRGIEWGGRREEDSEWGTHVYLWWIHFDIWQNQYNIVKLKNKIKKTRVFASCNFWPSNTHLKCMFFCLTFFMQVSVLTRRSGVWNTSLTLINYLFYLQDNQMLHDVLSLRTNFCIYLSLLVFIPKM